MKKHMILMAALMLIVLPLTAERVTPETARKVATTFLQNNGAKTAQMTELSQKAGFRNLYIFTTESSFVVMSADDCAKPILGYSLTGNFVTERMPGSMRSWLQGYNDEIQYAIDNRLRADSETAKEWKDLLKANPKAGKATTVVNALVQTKWDQNGYYYYSGGQLLIYELYNNLCPYYSNAGERTVTGCVATAMAQIMKYWNYPATGIGYHSYTPETLPSLGEQFVNFGETTYDWDNMPIQLSSSSTDAQKNAVATLMYHCGVSVNMDYNISSNGGSGAYANYIVPSLYNYFGYKLAEYKKKADYTDNNVWISMIKAELDASRPVQYNGSGNYGGHAFVCDGYNSSNQFHFNWGWSGQNDGFYSLTSLNPGSGGAGGGSYNFTSDQTAIFGIQPSGCTLSAPTNLSLSIEGIQSVTLTWDAVPGAASYNVYRDFNLVGNTTATTLTDTAPFGTNTYWVRCVDANNEMSLSSNAEVVNIDYRTPIVNDLTATYADNEITLSWTAPDWCYPTAPSNTITYGDQVPSSTYFPFDGSMYWGHRYLSSSLSAYNGMRVYSVDFYAYNAGTYELCIYEGASSAAKPSTLICTQSITVSSTGWYSIDLTNPHTLNNTKDLWVFIHNPEVIDGLRAILCSTSGSNGCCYSNNPLSYVSTYSGFAFLVKTYLTDGSYTYNLYDNGNKLNGNTPISGTSYTVGNPSNNTAHQYTVKTKYYGGETEASNMVGYTFGNATVSSLELGSNDKMTVTEGSKLTVSETLSDVNADNLILENGAQLIHNSEGVQATMKKNIQAYTSDNDGWYSLATPFSTYNPEDGLTFGTYDLYAYDEDGNSAGKEWINYKANPFNLTPGSGYLYANNATTTLSLAGTLNSGAYSQTVDLSYANSSNPIKGFNLIGNPTAHEISFTKTDNVSDGYYYLDNDNLWTYTTANTVPAGRGFLVKANAEGQSVTLNPQSKENSAESGQYVSVSIGDNTVYIKLDEGISMPQLNFRGRHNGLYLTQDHKHYAMLVSNNAETADLSYEPSSNGMQTLFVDTQGLKLDYLHLIDHLTGNDVDLLTNPSYTFESHMSDYATRFKLVFAPISEETDNETFAYISNGNIIVNGTGTIQIIDAMGRILLSREVNSSLLTPHSSLDPGVYVLRLINGDNVKTQKIVFE